MACELIMDGISFQKIYGLCGLKGHIVDIRGGHACGRTDEQRNMKIELHRILEFAKSRPLIMSLYGLKRILAKKKITIFDHF